MPIWGTTFSGAKGKNYAINVPGYAPNHVPKRVPKCKIKLKIQLNLRLPDFYKNEVKRQFNRLNLTIQLD